jgi:hypothetical protein
MVLASYRYPVVRGDRARFTSRADYIDKRVRARNGELCQVMQRAANLLQQADRRSSQQDDDSGWPGFPWLTMVFGSGALELHDRQELAAAAFAKAVEELVNAYSPWESDSDEDQAPAASVGNFAAALVRGRLGDAKGRADGEMITEALPEVEPVAAQLVHAAYLLTRFFHSVRADAGEPTSRWEYDDVARVTRESRVGSSGANDPYRLARDGTALMYDIIELLYPHQSSVPNPNTKAPQPIQGSVSALLQEIIGGLAPSGRHEERELRSSHLRLITEVAWYFLTLGTPIYPGWTDLLLALMLEEGPRADRGFRSARPRYPDLRALPSLVAGIYEPATKTSWEMTMKRLQSSSGEVEAASWSDIDDDEGRIRVNLYWAAAEVLWAQARESRKIPAGPSQLPPAAAFVTSFDLELDMALLATARGRTFRVALPVHLIHGNDNETAQAELCWLIADVKPASKTPDPGDLSALRRPENWRLLTSEFDPGELRDYPVVIHLSGCPLFRLPEPGTVGGDQAILGGPGDSSAASARYDAAVKQGQNAFAHAVTVDEYLALRQSEAELIWSSWYSERSQARSNRALPQDLMINGFDNPRFWISMGVPVGDAAIRHRLISQLSRQRLADLGSPSRSPMPSSAGTFLGEDLEIWSGGEQANAADQPPAAGDSEGAVGFAVNTRIGDDETSLLYWVGFDVVQDDCNKFIQDLRHYVRHLRASGPGKQPSLTNRCDLAGG